MDVCPLMTLYRLSFVLAILHNQSIKSRHTDVLNKPTVENTSVFLEDTTQLPSIKQNMYSSLQKKHYYHF